MRCDSVSDERAIGEWSVEIVAISQDKVYIVTSVVVAAGVVAAVVVAAVVVVSSLPAVVEVGMVASKSIGLSTTAARSLSNVNCM